MNPLTILIELFDWRRVLNRAAYRRNLSILVLVSLLVDTLGLFPGQTGYAWTAVTTVVGLSFDARRYHDMGRSAAWIVWANLIAAGFAIAVFQFFPNVLDALPLPEDWRVDAAGMAVFGRFVLPALVGLVVGNVFQSIWLAVAPSAVGPNPYVRAKPAGGRAEKDEDKPNEAAIQAMINRHLAQRQNEDARQSEAARPSGRVIPLNVGAGERARQFGRRGR